MKYLTALPLILAVSLSACSGSGDKYSDYLGYWENKDISQFTGEEVLKVAQISKDGESYLFKENIMSTKSKPLLLTANEGKLSANTGLGAIDFSLSDDKNTLYVSNKNFKKIDESLANQYQQDAEDCKTAITNYRAETKDQGVSQSVFLDDGQIKLKEQIQAKYKLEFERLQPYCKSPF